MDWVSVAGGLSGIGSFGALIFTVWRYREGRHETTRSLVEKLVAELRKDFESKLTGYTPRHEHNDLADDLKRLDAKLEVVRGKADRVEVVEAIVTSMSKSIDRVEGLLGRLLEKRT